MTLNLNKIGRPVCKIVGHVVSVSDSHGEITPDKADDDPLIKEFKRLNISKDRKLQHTINPNAERHILYITGCSGSGKSTYTRKYLEEYKKNIRTIQYIYLAH